MIPEDNANGWVLKLDLAFHDLHKDFHSATEKNACYQRKYPF